MLENQSQKLTKTLSLYWYLQYFAALGLFASIHGWVSICNQFWINFGTENPPKSKKKTIQNRLDFLIEFRPDFLMILAQFGSLFWSQGRFFIDFGHHVGTFLAPWGVYGSDFVIIFRIVVPIDFLIDFKRFEGPTWGGITWVGGRGWTP